jgi:hypothetical protein
MINPMIRDAHLGEIQLPRLGPACRRDRNLAPSGTFGLGSTLFILIW